MKLVDIMPIEKWVEIEKEINLQSGLNAAVYDVEGVRITGFKNRTTDLYEEFVVNLSEDIETIPNDRLESTISYLEKKVAEIIRAFGTAPQGSI